jgi:hypothetical protein
MYEYAPAPGRSDPGQYSSEEIDPVYRIVLQDGNLTSRG